MFPFLKNELPGHKWYRGNSDTILEWKEPALIRKRLATTQFKSLLRSLPIVFPILALIGLGLFAGKVYSKGHALSEAPWQSLLIISLVLGMVLSLQLFADVAILRWDSTVVRLAANGVGKWCSKPEIPIHCEYREISTAAVSRHSVVPEIPAIVLTLRDGSEAEFALSESLDASTVLSVLMAHGVTCIQNQAISKSPDPSS